MRRNTKILTLYVELLPGAAIREFVECARNEEITLSNLQMGHENSMHQGALSFLVTVKGKNKIKRDALLTTVKGFSCVNYLEEL